MRKYKKKLHSEVAAIEGRQTKLARGELELTLAKEKSKVTVNIYDITSVGYPWDGSTEIQLGKESIFVEESDTTIRKLIQIAKGQYF